MPGSGGQNLQNNLNINKQIIHNLAHLLYSNMNRSYFGHPSCDLSQDRQYSTKSFELIYPGIISHLEGPHQDLFLICIPMHGTECGYISLSIENRLRKVQSEG